MASKAKPYQINSLDLLASALTDIDQRIRQLDQEIADCERAGMVDASEWWKQDKYLYLVHPTRPDGTRRREYVGSEPAAVAEARARIERYKKWVGLKNMIKLLADRRGAAMRNIDHALWELKSVQRNLWGDE